MPIHDGPDANRVIVHVGLADGQAVFFTADEAAMGPNYFEAAPTRPTSTSTIMNVAFAVLTGGLGIAFTVLAVRNIRSGRGDVRGATRAALVLAGLGIMHVFFYADRQPSPQDVFFDGSGYAAAVWTALQFWLCYVAMEPAARRLWPHAMITWTRLVAGRARDPAVGRDALRGVLLGTGAMALGGAVSLGAQMIAGHESRPPVMPGEVPHGIASGIPEVTGRVVSGIMYAACGLFALVLGRILLRSTALAMAFAIAVLIATGAQTTASNFFLGFMMFVAIGIIALSQVRLGFLCGVVGMVSAFLLSSLNIGWDWSAPWGTVAWAAASVLAAVTAWGAWVATTDHRRARAA